MPAPLFCRCPLPRILSINAYCAEKKTKKAAHERPKKWYNTELNMGRESLERLLTAISYPDRAGVDGARAVLTVDGTEVLVEEIGRFLRLTAFLDIGENELPEFAGYVPGRIYKDAAILAMDAQGKAFLWQEVASSQDGSVLRGAFEAFMNSCDWWRARLDAGQADSALRFQDVLIRP